VKRLNPRYRFGSVGSATSSTGGGVFVVHFMKLFGFGLVWVFFFVQYEPVFVLGERLVFGVGQWFPGVDVGVKMFWSGKRVVFRVSI